MFIWLIAALFFVPLIEIALFVTVGGQIGLISTLCIVVVTAGLGSWLLALHGRGLRQRFADEMQATGFPAQSLFEGLSLGAAAIFLMTPGFFTDAVGFALFIPLVRQWLFRFLSAKVAPGAFQTWRSPSGFGVRGPIIDGESEDVGSPADEIQPNAPRRDGKTPLQ